MTTSADKPLVLDYAETPARRSRAAQSVRIILAISILGLFGWYLWHSRTQLSLILHIDRRYILPMIGVQLLSLLANGLVGRELVAEFGVRLSPLEWYGLAVVNALGNYLPLPQGGALARGVYLKRVHRLPYMTYAATLLVTYVSAVALYGVIGLAGLAMLRYLGRPSPMLLWLAFGALAGSLLLFTPLARWAPLPKRLVELNVGLATLRRHHLLARIVALQAALVALTTTGLWLACHSIPSGGAVTWPMAMMLGLMILASGIANVTPGNIGIEQFVAELAGRLLHVPIGVGLLASAIYRAVAIITIFALGPVLSALLAQRKPANANPES
jgi:uncharacterized membrane protein YbhN (UPF0104 family)